MSKRGHIPKPLFEPCTSGGVVLSVPKWADFEEWVDLRQVNKDYLQRWEPTWKDQHLTRHAYKAKLAHFKNLISQDDAYPFHVFRADDTNRFVGACNLTSVKRGSLQSAHIGYWIGQAYGRNGYARAAVRVVSRFAFEDLGLHRITAAVQVENVASIKLLESAGFVQEGLARSYLKVDGAWQDHLIYAKLATD